METFRTAQTSPPWRLPTSSVRTSDSRTNDSRGIRIRPAKSPSSLVVSGCPPIPRDHAPALGPPRSVARRVGDDESGAAKLEVELADLELLIRVRGPLHVLLLPVVLIRLDDGNPREILEKDLGHVAVGFAAELLVDGEARGVTQFVELRIAPVVHGAAGAEQAPHHAVRIAERRRRVRPPDALEGLLPPLLGAHRILDDLDLDVHANILPHRRDRFRH